MLGGIKTQKRYVLLHITILLALIPGMALADNAMMEQLGSRAARIAMQELDVEKGNASLLILTDAGHAIVEGQTTQAAIKGLSTESGDSIGDGNLFQVLRAHFKPSGSTSSINPMAKRSIWKQTMRL